MYFNKSGCCRAAPILFSALIATASFAGSMGEKTSFIKKGHPILSIGGFYGYQGTGQEIEIQTLVNNKYSVRGHGQGSGLVGVGYYFDAMQRDRFQLSYGVNAYFLGATMVSGYIVQENLFTNLSYRYKIQNNPLMFSSKAIINMNSDKYKLFVDAGIGPNFMRTGQYKEAVLTSYTLPDNAFSSHTDTVFAATIGAGVRFNNGVDKLPIECGYRFFYLGQGQLTKDNDQLISTIKTGDNYANAVICSVTF